MAYRAAICDDSAADAQYVKTLLEGWAGERELPLHTEVFPSAEAFLFAYAEDKDWDLLLLDIEMGQMDGVTMAKTVRRENEAVQIVFVTGYSDYIAEGYEVNALHYLMKPVDPQKLTSVLDRAWEKGLREERRLNLERGGELVRIPLREIQYLEVQKNYVTLHAKAEYTVKRTLAEFEAELDDRFFRVGRSIMVNLDHVRRVTRTEVYLDRGAALPLPRGAYEPLNRAIISHS